MPNSRQTGVDSLWVHKGPATLLRTYCFDFEELILSHQLVKLGVQTIQKLHDLQSMQVCLSAPCLPEIQRIPQVASWQQCLHRTAVWETRVAVIIELTSAGRRRLEIWVKPTISLKNMVTHG